jgi:membrane protein YdbS with pleckstrin-like domain
MTKQLNLIDVLLLAAAIFCIWISGFIVGYKTHKEEVQEQAIKLNIGFYDEKTGAFKLRDLSNTNGK